VGTAPIPPCRPADLTSAEAGLTHLVFLLLQLLHQVKLLRLQLVDPVGQLLGLLPGRAGGL
jgi:hypothetical protein